MRISGLHDPKCATVPVHAKLDELQSEYDKENSYYVQIQKTARMNEYAKLVLLTVKANYDIDLFLDEFFLRDESKAIMAMKLPGLDNISMVQAAAEKIPGLHTVSHGIEPTRTLAIGWDRNAVFGAAASASAEQGKKRPTPEDAVWKARMEKHQALIETCGIPRAGRQLRIHHLRGIFSIRCDDIAKQWPEDATNCVIRFTGVRFAIFNFGVLEGVMRFGLDRESAICDEFDSEGGYTNSDFDEDETAPSKAPNRAAPTPQKRSWHAPASASASSKRHKPSSSNPLRLYFQWRGRETREGMIQLDDDTNPTNTGYIDMSDERCMAFSGVANFGFAGEKVRFDGFKTQLLSGPATNKWKGFSKEVYEKERAGRWVLFRK